MAVMNHETNKPFWDHVADARRLLFVVVAIFLCAVGTVHYFHQDIIAFLLTPLQSDQPLQFLSPLEPLFFILKVDFIGALVITLPLLLVLLYRFVRPGPLQELFIPTLLILPSLTLGLTGAAYAHYVIIPIVLGFMQSLILPGMIAAFTATGFINFVLGTALLLVFLFQIPIVVVALASLGVCNPYQFHRYRRNVYLGLLVVTAVITPTTDVITLALVAIPSIVITELGVLVGRYCYPSPDE